MSNATMFLSGSFTSGTLLLERREVRDIPAGSIIFAQPVLELGSHLQELVCPSLALIARVIKTLVLSIFYRHFFDNVYIVNKTGIIRNSRDKIEWIERHHLEREHPFLFENAICLSSRGGLVRDVQFADIQTVGPLTPATICDYFQKFHQIELTPKKAAISHRDLLASPSLEMQVFRV